MRRVSSWRDAVTVVGFLAPVLALVGIFTIWPALWAVAQSFTNKSLIGVTATHPEFVGLQNYDRLLHDSALYASFFRTTVFVLFSAIIGQTLIGFAIAYLMGNRPGWSLRFTPMFAAIFLLPLAVPETVAALAWASVANGTDAGLANRLIAPFGVRPISWLQQYAFQTVTVINIWRGISFAMVLFAAALQSVPREIIEAAMVDGAGPWHRLRRVIVPMLRPQILMFVLLTTITTYGIFGLVYFLTRGGPGSDTELIGIYIYNLAFQFFDIGLGSAAAVLVLIILVGLGLYYVRLMREQV